jgi:hypothetical protein
MTLREKQSLFTQNVVHLINYIYSGGCSCTFGETWRTPEQAQIYANQGKGIKNSLHCKRLAVDLNLFDSNGKYLTNKSDYEPFGIYWESLHPANRWGGFFPKLVDSVHFEMQDL